MAGLTLLGGQVAHSLEPWRWTHRRDRRRSGRRPPRRSDGRRRPSRSDRNLFRRWRSRQPSYCGRRRRFQTAGDRPGCGGGGGSRSPSAPTDPTQPNRPSPRPAGAPDRRSPSCSPTRSWACTAATASGGGGSAAPRPGRRTAGLRGENTAAANAAVRGVQFGTTRYSQFGPPAPPHNQAQGQPPPPPPPQTSPQAQAQPPKKLRRRPTAQRRGGLRHSSSWGLQPERVAPHRPRPARPARLLPTPAEHRQRRF
jgi:hypothetical protein